MGLSCAEPHENPTDIEHSDSLSTLCRHVTDLRLFERKIIARTECGQPNFSAPQSNYNTVHQKLVGHATS